MLRLWGYGKALLNIQHGEGCEAKKVVEVIKDCADDKDVQKTLYFDDNIMANILAKVPVGLVWSKCMYQCQQWSSLITDPYFADASCRRSKEGIIFMETVVDIYGSKTFFINFMHEKGPQDFQSQILGQFNTDLHIRSSCNGLLLVQRRFEYPSYVINPITKKGVELNQPSRKDWSWHELVYVPSKREFKVVELFYSFDDDDDTAITMDIQTLDHRSTQIQVPRIYSEYMMSSGNQVAVDGVLYWNCSSKHIVSFDLCTEIYRYINWPDKYRSGRQPWYKLELKTIGGHLSFVAYANDNEVDVWVLKDIDRGNWINLATIHIEPVVGNPNGIQSIIGSFHNGDVLVLKNQLHGVSTYDVKSQTRTDIINDSYKRYGSFPHIHFNSLFSVAA